MDWIKLILNVLLAFIGKGWLWNIAGGTTEGAIRGFYWVWSQPKKVRPYGIDNAKREALRGRLTGDLDRQLPHPRVPAGKAGSPADAGTTARTDEGARGGNG